jgi:hypothetical protein
MKTTQVLMCSLAAGAVLFAAGKASAQGSSILQNLKVSGSFTYTSSDVFVTNTTTTVETSKSAKAAFNNAKIIAMWGASAQFLSDAGIAAIPARSFLVMDDSGDIILTNKTVVFRVNLSATFVGGFGPAYASISSAGSADADSGKVTFTPTAQYGSGKGISATETLTIVDGVNTKIVISGLSKHTDSASKPNATTLIQTVHSSGSITGSGAGTYPASVAGDLDAVVQGKASASGSGKILPPS